jgi:DNA polymerase-3 subunit beta
MAYTFEGILFNIDENGVELVGTDGKRIAIAAEKVKSKKAKENRSLVPIATLRTLLNIIAISPDDTVKIKVSANHIIFEDSTSQLISQLIEGRFPEYRNYIPADYQLKAVFSKETLSSGIRKADIMTSQETHLVRFGFSKDQMLLNMTSRCLDRGTSEVSIPMEKYEGDDITVGFNGRHILDVLRVLNEEKVTWHLKEDQGPGEINEGDTFKYVFMPVKLK